MPKRMGCCWMAAMVLLCAELLGAEEKLPAAPAWDAATFKAKDASERLKFAREVLAWRDKCLSNCSFDVASFVQNLDAKTREVKKDFHHKEYSFYRLGDKYLGSGIADSGYAGDIDRRFWSRWDGAVYRGFVEGGNKNRASGNIQSKEHDLLLQVEYNLLLGWRVHGKTSSSRGYINHEPLMLAEWVDFFLKKGKDSIPQANLVDVEGKAQIELKAVDNYTTYTYWLDPARSFMPVKYRNWYQYKNFEHGGETKVTEATQIEGFWVPTRVVWGAKMIGDDSQIQERTYTATKFSLGTVKEADLLVDMRPGAEVVDVSTGIAYKIDAEGKATAKPLGDSKTGKARTATDAELAEALEINPIKDDISDAAVAKRKARIAEILARNEARRRAEDPVLDKLAPAFPAQAKWHNGNALTWEQLRGKVVILHFFAEWCGPCKNDYPMLAQLHSNKRADLVIIGIHTAGSDAEKVKKLLTDYKIAYPVCEDVAPGPEKGWGEFCNAMGAKMAPHAILIDPQGKVVERGALMDIYDSAIKLMAEKKTQ